MKAIIRAIQSAKNLNCWGNVIEWCDKGLLIDSSHQDFIKERALAVKEKVSIL